MRLALILVTLFSLFPNDASAARISLTDRILKRAYRLQQSEIQVRFSGTVVAVLTDDDEGDRHQRFIVELDSGQTLLIAHNIDVAPRVKWLRERSEVTIRGEYIWNDKGGIVHFTHRSSHGDHPGGWIRCKGRKYE